MPARAWPGSRCQAHVWASLHQPGCAGHSVQYCDSALAHARNAYPLTWGTRAHMHIACSSTCGPVTCNSDTLLHIPRSTSPLPSSGYCNTAGRDDPQCNVACAKCRRCVSTVDALRSALNASGDVYEPYGNTTALATAAFGMCMQRATAAANATGKCLALTSAMCSVSDRASYCGSLPGCYQMQSCRRADPAKCDATAPTPAGVACRVRCLLSAAFATCM